MPGARLPLVALTATAAAVLATAPPAPAAVDFAPPGAPYSLGTLPADPTTFWLGDYDGNGHADLVATLGGTNHQLIARRAGKAGGWRFPDAVGAQSNSGTGTARTLHVGDVTGDGTRDVVVVADTALTTSPGSATAFAGASPFVSAAAPPFATGAVGQWNASSAGPELLAVRSTGAVSVYTNPGSSFTAGPGFTSVTSPVAAAIADVDQDGEQDAVVAGGTGIEVVRGDGTGGVASRVLRALPSTPAALAVGDLDGDGRPDLAVALPDAQSVRWFPSANLTTAPAGGEDLPIGRAARDLTIVDLDGDGRNELVTADPQAQTVTVVAPGVAARSFPSLLAPTRLQVHDVTEDGRLDVVTLDPTTRTVVTLAGREPDAPAPPGPPTPPAGGSTGGGGGGATPGPSPGGPPTPGPGTTTAKAPAVACTTVRRRRAARGFDCTVTVPGGVAVKRITATLRRGRTTVATKTITKGRTLKLRRARGRALARGGYAVAVTITPRTGKALTARTTRTIG